MSSIITAELLHVESDARRARAQVFCARTIDEVVRASQVRIPGHLHALTRSLPEIRSLHSSTTQRLEALVEGQLKDIEKLPAEARKEALARLKNRDWSLLRGDHASVLSRALRRADQILASAERELRPA